MRAKYNREALARLVCVSTRTLDRCFRKQGFGEVNQWLSELQLRKADEGRPCFPLVPAEAV